MPPAIPVTHTTRPKLKPCDGQLRFGEIFTDHMFVMDGSVDRGWHSPRIVPYGPLSLDPTPQRQHSSRNYPRHRASAGNRLGYAGCRAPHHD